MGLEKKIISILLYFALNSDSENQDGWYIYLSDDELNDDEIEALQKKVSIS